MYESLDYAEYFKGVWDYVPEYIVSDEMYDKNEELINAITYDFFRQYQDTGFPSTQTATKMVEVFFSNVLKYGYR
jgi:hypothetical protein